MKKFTLISTMLIGKMFPFLVFRTSKGNKGSRTRLLCCPSACLSVYPSFS